MKPKPTKSQEIPWRRFSIQVPWIAFAAAFTILSLMSLTQRTALAQASAGITGTVTDTSGAVVTNAHVTITNEDTGIASRTVTSSAGTYTIKGLTPGHYSITVDESGFKKEVKKGVAVEVSTNATVDISLTPGSATETVQVTSDQNRAEHHPAGTGQHHRARCRRSASRGSIGPRPPG